MSKDIYDTLSLSKNLRHREKKLCEFYSKIIHEFYEQEIKNRAVRNLLRSTNDLSVAPKTFKDENFQCAYLCQLGVHNTCMVAQHFYKFMKKHTVIVDKLRKKGKIYICCFGNTIVLEAVGICTIIDEVLQQFGVLNDVTTEIHMLVLSQDETWKSVSEYVLQETKEMLKNVQLHFQFHTEGFPGHLSEKAISWLKQADFVTMVNYLSSCTSAEDVVTVIQQSQKAMKKHTVLFYVANNTKYEPLLCRNWYRYYNVYSTSAPKKYNLKDETVKVQESLYSDTYLKFAKYEFRPMTVSAWIKETFTRVRKVTDSKSVAVEDWTIGKNVRKSKEIGNSNTKCKLDGKFAYMDLEKKNKNKKYRQTAKEVSISRYSDFDDY